MIALTPQTQAPASPRGHRGLTLCQSDRLDVRSGWCCARAARVAAPAKAFEIRHELEKDQAMTDENDNLKFDAQD